jgi:hypothetical protein
MANAQYALKVVNALRREANANAGICTDSRFGKSSLTTKQLEQLEDQLEAEITRPMIGTESVTERGDKLAREIAAKHFAGLPL